MQNNANNINNMYTIIHIMDNTTTKSTLEKLEKDALVKVQQLHQSNTTSVETLTKIMDDGQKEFQAKMGRTMTYAEMRAAYG